MRRRLFWQLFVGFFLVVVVTTAVVGTLGRIAYNTTETQEAIRPLAEFLAESLELDSSRPEALQSGIAKSESLGIALAVYDSDGALIGASVDGLPTPADKDFEPTFFRFRGESGYLIDLSDGRWIAAARVSHRTGPQHVFIIVLLIFVAVAALGCLLLARRIVRRVEALETSVAAWGDGDLTARVPSLGVDEIGRLGERFNHAADRVAELVDAHRQVVAHASHELRTPLTRLRLALTMLAESEDMSERARLLSSSEADIEDLDALIEQLLLRSKLGARQLDAPKVAVDLVALVQKRWARHGGEGAQKPPGWALEVPATPVVVMGDERMLSQAVDNLLTNAGKYGGPVVCMGVLQTGSSAVVCVADDGDGIPATHRARLFEPFYQVDAAATGVGLGLSLVLDIAQWHGGAAEYEPPTAASGALLATGSRFLLKLPLA